MLKAVAIVMIMTHNFAHLLDGITPENEYTFRIERVMQLCSSVLHPDADLLLHVLSFFGHYGVPVFLFLSGYGLVMKYERGAAIPRADKFIGRHYVKLLKLMALGLLAFYIIFYFQQDNFNVSKKNVLAQLLMYVNLLPEPWFRVKPGPYWFFGLMMQLYVLYRLVLYAPLHSTWRRWLWPAVLVMGCWLLQTWGARQGSPVLYWIRYNFPVAALPFSMGLLAARYPRSFQLRRWQWCLVAILAAVCVGVMNFKLQLWLWSPVLVVVAAIALVKALPECCHGVLVWLGGVSAMLFVVHPLVRALLLGYAQGGSAVAYAMMLVYLAVSLVLAVGYRWLLNRIRI